MTTELTADHKNLANTICVLSMDAVQAANSRHLGRFRPTGNWVAEVFRTLPECEAAHFRDIGD